MPGLSPGVELFYFSSFFLFFSVLVSVCLLICFVVFYEYMPKYITAINSKKYCVSREKIVY